jgi:hypothetical protein
MAENNLYIHNNHNKQELRNFSVEKVASHPTGAGLYEGRLWSLDTDHKFYRYDGNTVHQLVDAQDLNKFGVFVGTHDATTGLPTTGSGVDASGNPLSGTASIQAGDFYRISVAGTITGIEGNDALDIGDLLIATADGATAASQFLGVQQSTGGVVLTGSGAPDVGTRWVSSTVLGQACFKDNGNIASFGGALDGNTKLKIETSLQYPLAITNTGTTTANGGISVLHTGTAANINLISAGVQGPNKTGSVKGLTVGCLGLTDAGTVRAISGSASGGAPSGSAIGLYGHGYNAANICMGANIQAGDTASLYYPTEGTSVGLIVVAKENNGNLGNIIGTKIDVTKGHVDNNYGLIIETSNSGAGNSWPLWIRDGNQAAGKVLVSDADGKSTWGNLDTNNIITTSTTTTATSITPTFSIIYCNTASNSITVNLPAAASSVNKIFNIKRISAGTNLVTISPNGSETIDGNLTVVLYAQWDAIRVHCDGTNWYIMP